MARCAICGKSTTTGMRVATGRSHVTRRTLRAVKPNLRSVKVNIDGENIRLKICASCLRAAKKGA